MYLSNKYTIWYYRIISNAQSRVLPSTVRVERHHVVPKSMGGDNSSDNLADLTLREHYVCHRLLTKMTVGVDREKMALAVWCMCVRRHHKIPSRTYELLRLNQISVVREKMIIEHRTTRKGKPGPNAGRKMSEAAKLKSSNTKKAQNKVAWNRGSQHSEESKQLMSQRKKANANIAWNKGVTHSDETKQKLSELAKNRTVYVCPHCGKSATGGNYKRWHGDNCTKRA